MTVLVPDSIEPWYGYKALVIQGTDLCSPQQHAVWPKREPLEASCTKSTKKEFHWEIVAAPPGWEAMFWVPSTYLSEGQTTTFGWPPHEPPEGHTWIPVAAPHQIGKCSCGIYAVDSASQLSYYLQGPDRLIVQIALWGQVVIANKGARGQYAYPQRIFCAEQQQQAATAVAAEYDIPIEIVRFIDKENE